MRSSWTGRLLSLRSLSGSSGSLVLLGYLSLELGSQGSLGLLGTDVYSIGKMLDSSVVQNTGQLTDGLCWGLRVMSLRLGSLGPLGFFSGPEWVSRVSLRVLWGLGPLGCLSAPGQGLRGLSHAGISGYRCLFHWENTGQLSAGLGRGLRGLSLRLGSLGPLDSLSGLD